MPIPFVPPFASANTPFALPQRDGSGNFYAGTITASLTGTASGNIAKADILLFSANHVVTPFQLSDYSNSANTTLRAAMTASVSGDEIWIKSPGEYAMGTTVFNIKAGVLLAASDWLLVKLSSTYSTNAACCFELHNGSKVRGIWFDASLRDGTFQFPIGVGDTGNTGVTAYIDGCKITGDSDGLYSWSSNIVIYCSNSFIQTGYDAVAGLGGNLTDQTFYLTNCDIIADTSTTLTDGVGGDNGTGTNHSANCVNMAGGTAYVSNCRLKAIGKVTSNYARGVTTLASNCNAYISGGSINTSGAIATYDLYEAGASHIYANGGIGSAANKTYTYVSDTPPLVATQSLYGYITAVDKTSLDRSTFHEAVRAVSVSNVDVYSGGPKTIDGVSCVTGDRILLADQTDPAENGIWVIRASSCDQATDLADIYTDKQIPYLTVLVGEGTVYGRTTWTLTNAAGYSVFDGLNFKVNGGGWIRHLRGLINDNVSGAAVSQKPSVAGGTGAGATPATPTLDANATDLCGTISVTPAASPDANAVIATLTFKNAYATAPHIILTPANAAAAALSGTTQIHPTSTTTTLVLNSGSAALTASTAYSWNYMVAQ